MVRIEQLLLDFLSWCPGAAGLILRQKLYPRFLHECGPKVLFGRFVVLKGHRNIRIGKGVVINEYAVLDAEQGPPSGIGITIEDQAFIGAGTRVIALGGEIVIEKNANLGSECLIEADRQTIIGSDVLVAAYCRIGGCGGEKNDEEAGAESGCQQKRSDTRIGRGSWLGVRAVVPSGVQIGEETVVGAHSVVEDILPPYVVAVGNPARLLYSRREGVATDHLVE